MTRRQSVRRPVVTEITGAGGAWTVSMISELECPADEIGDERADARFLRAPQAA
jgi:hypothetical protein